ncbi:MAG: NBR1-Ig-like domain-containing protein [Anaerolineales bacterium]
MNRKIIILIVFLLVVATLPGCNFPWTSDVAGPPVSGGAAQTAAAETVSAQLTLNAQQGPPQPLNTDPPSQPGSTSGPTNTLEPTNTQQPTNTATDSIPCDKAGFVSENVPDGTEFAAGDTFTKKWVIKNNGSCTWTSGYQWVFSSGDAMGGSATKQITSGTVAPGQSVEIELDLTAPASPGTYRGTYKIRNSGGQTFTPNGFWVEIKVVAAFSYVLTFENFLDCPPEMITVKTRNNGSEHLESAQFKVVDRTASVDLAPWGAIINKPWRDGTNCTFAGAAIGDVEPGDYYYITISGFGPLVSGHDIRVYAKICSENGGGGDCITQHVDSEAP